MIASTTVPAPIRQAWTGESNRPVYEGRVDAAIDDAEARLGEELTVETLAAVAHCSRSRSLLTTWTISTGPHVDSPVLLMS